MNLRTLNASSVTIVDIVGNTIYIVSDFAGKLPIANVTGEKEMGDKSGNKAKIVTC